MKCYVDRGFFEHFRIAAEIFVAFFDLLGIVGGETDEDRNSYQTYYQVHRTHSEKHTENTEHDKHYKTDKENGTEFSKVTFGNDPVDGECTEKQCSCGKCPYSLVCLCKHEGGGDIYAVQYGVYKEEYQADSRREFVDEKSECDDHNEFKYDTEYKDR